MATSDMFNTPSIKAKTIQVPAVDASRIGQTGDWTNTVQRIDLGLTNLQKTKEQLKVGEGKDQTKLQARIEKAEREGKEDKVARLQGRQDRQDVRQKARAERIKTRNTERLAQTQARQDKKDKKFADRREDGNVPISSPGQLLQGGVDLFKKDAPTTMKMSAKQYKDEQKFSKIAKDI